MLTFNYLMIFCDENGGLHCFLLFLAIKYIKWLNKAFNLKEKTLTLMQREENGCVYVSCSKPTYLA